MDGEPDEGGEERLAEGWFAYRRLSTGSRADRKSLETDGAAPEVAAHDAVQEAMFAGGDRAVRVIECLVAAAQSDDDLLAVGVGPLEDLLAEHGDDICEAVVDAARRNPRLAKALKSGWLNASFARPDIARKLAPWVPDLARKLDASDHPRG